MLKGPKWYDKVYTDEIIGKAKPMALILHWATRIAAHVIGSVLDLGCGTAVLAEQIEGNYVGVDFSSVVIKHAEERVKVKRVKFKVADIYKFVETAKNNEFDTVVLSEVLEHLERPDDIVREAKRIAKCKIIITVPMNSPNPGHVQDRWTIKDLRRLIGPLAVIEDIRGFWLVVWEKNGRQTETLKKH